MLRDLDYQARVLKTFDEFLSALSTHKQNADKIAALALQQPELGLEIPDFPAKTWEAMRAAGKLPASRKEIPFSQRHDGIGRPVPNVVLKVPTGGGKTYLAASALSRLFGRYLGKNTGFVLWVVPNEAIYTQTKKQLTDRQHPYRQMLDRAAAGRVRILEKDDRLDARDIESSLCVMLLMLQSANRQTRESLKMFQDRGDGTRVLSGRRRSGSAPQGAGGHAEPRCLRKSRRGRCLLADGERLAGQCIEADPTGGGDGRRAPGYF